MTRLDPDELALLEEERDHLLASLEDLEREFAVGDMDEGDYRSLKDDYTVRAADVLEAIERRQSLIRSGSRAPRRGRAVVVAACVLSFAVLAGVLVARGAGQRGGGTISGGIDNLRSELARCQTASMQDPPAGIECYDDLLADAPGNVEALTYQGWAYIRDDRVAEGAANFARAVEIDPDYPDVRVFRAVVASRAGDFEAAAAEIDRFYRNDPSPASVQILQSQGLEREIFVRLLDDATRTCWVDAARATQGYGGQDGGDGTGGGGEGGADAAAAGDFLGSLGTCLDGVIAADPGNSAALVSKAYAVLAPGTHGLAQGIELAERAVAADPDDPNARLMRASVALADGRPADAAADLDAIEGAPRPTMSFLIGGPEQIRDAIAQVTGPTTTEQSAGSTRPSVPNPDGG